MKRVAEHFDRSYAENMKAAPERRGPIFIMGLPRSGTTLVDRIVSSHSDVESMGEITDFAMTMTRLCWSLDKRQLIEASARIDPDRLGQAYFRSVAGYGSKVPYFIDKTPINFLYVGLIAKALPGASMIHVRRHPVDNCLSMYRTLFRTGYPFSYDLDDLAEYYIAYDRLMKHPQTAFPGAVLDVSYEELVEDQERVSMEIIGHCGLAAGVPRVRQQHGARRHGERRAGSGTHLSQRARPLAEIRNPACAADRTAGKSGHCAVIPAGSNSPKALAPGEIADRIRHQEPAQAADQQGHQHAAYPLQPAVDARQNGLASLTHDQDEYRDQQERQGVKEVVGRQVQHDGQAAQIRFQKLVDSGEVRQRKRDADEIDDRSADEGRPRRQRSLGFLRTIPLVLARFHGQPEQRAAQQAADREIDGFGLREVLQDLLQADADHDPGGEIGHGVPGQHGAADQRRPRPAGRVDHEGEQHRIQNVYDKYGKEKRPDFHSRPRATSGCTRP
jgi:hypothetical protein